MLKRLCFNIIKESESLNINKLNISLKHPVDFLKYTDEAIFSCYLNFLENSDKIKIDIKNLINRKLWVRAQMVSGFNIQEEKINEDLRQIEEDLFNIENENELKRIKNEIINESRIIDSTCGITEKDIWIDAPFSPSVKEAKQIEIKKLHKNDDNIPFLDVFPLEHWVEAYKANKWRCHIFCFRKFQKIVYEASNIVLKRGFNITIQDFTKDYCKIEN